MEKERIHEDIFKMSATKLDGMITNQKGSKGKGGLGFEIGESLKSIQTSNTEKEDWR